jgi:1,2-dihydroxy-3-keto-5-methylthiopentene dioxygenase
MSRLQVFTEGDPESVLLDTTDGAEIAEVLTPIGVMFERWPTRDAGGDPLTAYAPEVEKLKSLGGYQSIDCVSVVPDHPDRAAMRTKFLDEHTHAEDEVRFFVEGEGLFTLHADGKVWNVLCCEGDLMSVPAGMKHWFDMGPAPRFTAIRLFLNPDGWIASFTGDDIAARFPRHEPVAA